MKYWLVENGFPMLFSGNIIPKYPQQIQQSTMVFLKASRWGARNTSDKSVKSPHAWNFVTPLFHHRNNRYI